MNQKILKLGRIKLVLMITVIAVFLAITTDALIAEILSHDINLTEDLLRAAIIPLLIAPVISWYLVGILYELERLEKKMTLLANYDDLTGLLSRRAFYEACDILHKYSIRNKQNYSVLTIDLDYFKKINDKHGHAGGDEVLKLFGKVIKEFSRNSDLLGRVGGEEFSLFLPNTNLKQANDFSEKLRKAINSKRVFYSHIYIDYTVSIGISTNLCNKNIPLDKILKESDAALYLAKNKGRNQVAIHGLNANKCINFGRLYT